MRVIPILMVSLLVPTIAVWSMGCRAGGGGDDDDDDGDDSKNDDGDDDDDDSKSDYGDDDDKVRQLVPHSRARAPSAFVASAPWYARTHCRRGSPRAARL